jgi:DNA-directed RNA polymerase specialized sigma24 family protein
MARGSSRIGWSLTPEAFDAFLSRLHPDREQAGDRYEALRRKLTRLFAWRGCANPEELADETLDRAARRLAEGAELTTDLPGYVHGVAMRVVQEERRRARPAGPDLDRVARVRSAPEAASEADEAVHERRLACLQECLRTLPPEGAELIRAYHPAVESDRIRARHALAEKLGLTANALRIRVFRLRAALDACIRDCEGRAAGGEMKDGSAT